MTVLPSSHRVPSSDVVAFHDSVRDTCVDRIRDALDRRTWLFERQLRDGSWAPTLGTEALTSSAICLIGVSRAAVEPERVGLVLPKALDALAAVTRRSAYLGGLGLVVWANAVWDGLPLPVLLERTGMSLARPSELVARLTTMETAWLVSGLVHEARRRGSDDCAIALDAAVAELLSRYRADARLFVHAGPAAPLGHRLRRWVANFADQIYSVQALALFSVVRGDRDALEAASRVAERLVALQGDLGQWWWHYDARRGDVARAYPVYSVHQHGMAPMALATLAVAGGGDHARAIELSHAWVGRNELGVDLFDRAAGTVWRDVEPSEGAVRRAIAHARSVVGAGSGHGSRAASELRINRETRPYEWAWCLFAGALAAGAARERHVV